MDANNASFGSTNASKIYFRRWFDCEFAEFGGWSKLETDINV
jgi:hypothetical protein